MWFFVYVAAAIAVDTLFSPFFLLLVFYLLLYIVIVGVAAYHHSDFEVMG